MTKQTAVEWLFLEFKALSKVARDAGDEESANLIDFLCEREKQAKEMEKQQILFAYNDGAMGAFEKTYKGMHQYYNENYGGNK
jgi:predicted esterase